MSWHFSLALVAGFSAAHCSAGEPSAPWKSMPTAPDDSCSDKMKGTFHHSPFGTMFVPSTDARGAAALASYRRAFLAKTLALPALATDSTALTIDEPDLVDYLGRPRFLPESAERTAVPGVATGLAVTGLGADLPTARDRAYSAIDRISWDGMYIRRDIGHRSLG